jgi:nucleoside-diphosphate-sugar epimerase
MILERLGWEPSTKLRDGMEKTYRWIEGEIASGASGK